MTRLTELALAFARRDLELRALDAAAGAGDGLVALLEAFWGEPRYAGLPDATRAVAVLRRVRGADREDDGARAAVAAWASARGVEYVDVVGFGEPLAYGGVPVQGELFGETRVPQPPWTFGDAPFDIVLADVPHGELTGAERGRLRTEFATAAGSFPAEVPFVERLLDLVSADGVVAVRMRTAVVRREYGRALVDELARRTRFLTVERDGTHLLLVVKADATGDGGALLRALGSERAARVIRGMVRGSRGGLGAHVESTAGVTIGAVSTPGHDDVWEVPRWLEDRVPTRPFVRGADVSDWRVDASTRVAWPYAEDGGFRAVPDAGVVDWLSRFRRLLEMREIFGRPLVERRVRWFEYGQHNPARWGKVPAVVMARSGAYPRVAVIRAPAVIAGSAFVIGARDEADALWIAGVLGSSLGAFWMAQSFHVYPTEAGIAFEATAAGLAEFPMPSAGADGVVEAMRRVDQLARSLRAPRSAIAGEPERLGSRLVGVAEANARVRVELDAAERALDEAVLAAFGLHEDGVVREEADDYARRRGVRHGAGETERDALRAWLVDLIIAGFRSGALAADAPVSADLVADWVRAQPLARAVLVHGGIDVADAMMDAAVPREADVAYSASGLAKLRAWAQGEPGPFGMDDYAGAATEVPAASIARQRRRIWQLRGRYNVAREPFVYFREISRATGIAHFCWAAGATAAESAERVRSEAAAAQVDLDRMLRLRAVLAQGALAEPQLADRLFEEGWSAGEVRVTLEALERAGGARRAGRRWTMA